MPDMKGDARRPRGVQSLEDALIDNGWDEITIRTEHGLFTWRTDQREAEVDDEGPNDEEDDGR